MRKATYISCLCFFLLISREMSVSVNAYDKTKSYKVVYFNPDVTIEDPITAVSAMKPFTAFVGKKLDIKLEPYFFKKQSDLDRFLDNNEVAFGIFSQMYIVENFRKRNFEPIVIVLKEGQPFYRKVILVRKDSDYETLDDLKGKILATTALGDDNIPFLNKVVFRGEIDVKTHFGKMEIVDSANSAIMSVLYKQADAAAANYLNFVFLKELNPQVGKNLKTIFTSAETPLPGMVYFKDNVEMELVDKARSEMLIMHDHPVGSQTMLAFQVEAWAPATLKNWEETARLLNISLTDTPEQPISLSETVETAAADKGLTPMSGAEQVKKASISFRRISASYNESENRVEIKTSLNEDGVKVDPEKIFVSYRLSSGQSGTQNLKPDSGTSFRGSIPIPEQSGTMAQVKTKYIVKPGDTLGKIATKFLGDSRKYMMIATLNNIADPNKIYVGVELTILSGEFSGIDITYSITARDLNGAMYQSPEKFISVVR